MRTVFAMGCLLVGLTGCPKQSADSSVAVAASQQFDASAFQVVEQQLIRTKTRVKPSYPTAAKSQGFGGECMVRLFIDETGTPVHATPAEDCSPLFKDAAIEAGMKWRFHPTEIDGVAVKVQFPLKLKWSVNGP